MVCSCSPKFIFYLLWTFSVLHITYSNRSKLTESSVGRPPSHTDPKQNDLNRISQAPKIQSSTPQHQQIRKLVPVKNNYSHLIRTNTPKDDDIIVFPSPPSPPPTPNPDLLRTHVMTHVTPDRSSVSNCSKNLGGTFCTNVSNYPRGLTNRILLQTRNIQNEVFGNDSLMQVAVETRLQPEQHSLCTSVEELVFPQAAQTKTEDWKFIIQGTEESTANLKQGVRVEVCKNVDQPCMFGSADNLPNGYETQCVQKFIYRKLAALTNNGELHYDSFKIPACCECMYRTTTNLFRNLAPSSTSTATTKKQTP